jgi:SAM-dependent methyltransferase
MQTDGTLMSASPFCRRASRSKAAGAKTEGEPGFLFFRIGGKLMQEASKEEEAMESGTRRGHWEGVYTEKGEAEVSWFQETPAPSLELLRLIGAAPSSALIDIGGGASRLVDSLLAQGFVNITVLDLSQAALAKARARLGDEAGKVKWVVADVTQWHPTETYDVWHDRAAFHFLTDAEDQAAYLQALKEALRRGGHAIIGTFALDGPEKCSGLPVQRHSAESLGALLGQDFTLLMSRRHEHVTPWNSVQRFQFSTFRRRG